MSNTELNNQLVNWLSQESTESFLTEMLDQTKADENQSEQKLTSRKQLFISTANDLDEDNTAPQPQSPFSPSDIAFPKHVPSPNSTLKHHQQIRHSLSPQAGSRMDAESTPPRSPSSSKTSRDDMTFLLTSSPRVRSESFAARDSSRSRSASTRQNFGSIKQFYFPYGIPENPQYQQQELKKIEKLFAEHDNRLTVSELSEICVNVVGLSSYCTGVLFNKIKKMSTPVIPSLSMPSPQDSISFEDFMKFWPSLQKYGDAESRLYLLLHDNVDDEKKNEDGDDESRSSIQHYSSAKYLTRANFNPLVEYVLEHHPGLEFLSSASNFHGKYVRTVIERIFYELSGSGADGITLRDLRRSNFMSVLGLLDTEEDINDVFDYFSYEHFYVIYCKFWELDSDHDGFINRKQLEKYAEYSVTRRVIQRVMDGIPRKLRAKNKGEMCYEDFIPFIIAEEDKKNPVSVEYWFRVLDLDGDGYLSPYELKYFYEDQARRIRRISRDVIDFRDYLCQLNDMIHPDKEALFSLRDLKRSKLCHLFFNMLFNLNKFALHESRDPYLIEEIRNTPQMTDWDRFASSEYARYVDEDGFGGD